jgi:hypothetical protein
MADNNIDHEFVVELINKYGSATESCSKIAKSRPPLAPKYIKMFSGLSSKEISGFVIYKYMLANTKCIESKSGYPLVLLVSVMEDDDTPAQVRKSLELLLKIAPRRYRINSFFVYRSIPPEKVKILDDIDYFNSPFDFVRTFELIKNNQKMRPLMSDKPAARKSGGTEHGAPMAQGANSV